MTDQPALPVGDFPLSAADRCVLCGLCLPHCPIYRLLEDENESPRGRISLLRAVATGALPLDDRVAGHWSRCLDCRACERACPSGVPYGELIGAGRKLVAAHQRPGLLTRLLLWLASRRDALKAFGLALRLAQGTGVLTVVNRLWRQSAMLRFLAATSQQQNPSPANPDAVTVTRKVILFRGCLASVLDAETLARAERLLRRLGVDVFVPEAQTCCGGLHREAGDARTADVLLARNRAVLTAEGAEAVITLASGCGARLAGQLEVPVLDIHEYLARLPLPAALELAPLSQRVAVQDPCSLRNSLRAEQHVYTLLRRIPELTVEPLAENTLCCGGAGLYPLREPELASQLRAPKLETLEKTRPDMLVSANLGCALHLRAGLRARGLNLPVLHPVVLFERQLRDRPGLRSVAP